MKLKNLYNENNALVFLPDISGMEVKCKVNRIHSTFAKGIFSKYIFNRGLYSHTFPLVLKKNKKSRRNNWGRINVIKNLFSINITPAKYIPLLFMEKARIYNTNNSDFKGVHTRAKAIFENISFDNTKLKSNIKFNLNNNYRFIIRYVAAHSIFFPYKYAEVLAIPSQSIREDYSRDRIEYFKKAASTERSYFTKDINSSYSSTNLEDKLFHYTTIYDFHGGYSPLFAIIRNAQAANAYNVKRSAHRLKFTHEMKICSFNANQNLIKYLNKSKEFLIQNSNNIVPVYTRHNLNFTDSITPIYSIYSLRNFIHKIYHNITIESISTLNQTNLDIKGNIEGVEDKPFRDKLITLWRLLLKPWENSFSMGKFAFIPYRISLFESLRNSVFEGNFTFLTNRKVVTKSESESGRLIINRKYYAKHKLLQAKHFIRFQIHMEKIAKTYVKLLDIKRYSTIFNERDILNTTVNSEEFQGGMRVSKQLLQYFFYLHKKIRNILYFQKLSRNTLKNKFKQAYGMKETNIVKKLSKKVATNNVIETIEDKDSLFESGSDNVYRFDLFRFWNKLVSSRRLLGKSSKNIDSNYDFLLNAFGHSYMKPSRNSSSVGKFVFVPHGISLVVPSRYTGNFVFIPFVNYFTEFKREFGRLIINTKLYAERKLLQEKHFIHFQKYMEKINKIYKNFTDKKKYNTVFKEQRILLNTIDNNGNLKGKIMFSNHKPQYFFYLDKKVEKSLNFETAQAVHKNNLVFVENLKTGNYILKPSTISHANRDIRYSDFKHVVGIKEINKVKKHSKMAAMNEIREVIKEKSGLLERRSDLSINNVYRFDLFRLWGIMVNRSNRVLGKFSENISLKGECLPIAFGNSLLEPSGNNGFASNFTFVSSGNPFVESKRGLDRLISRLTINAKLYAERKYLQAKHFICFQKHIKKISKTYVKRVDKKRYSTIFNGQGILLNTTVNSGKFQGMLRVPGQLLQYSFYLNKKTRKSLIVEVTQALNINLISMENLKTGKYISKQSDYRHTNQDMGNSVFKLLAGIKEITKVKKHSKMAAMNKLSEVTKEKAGLLEIGLDSFISNVYRLDLLGLWDRLVMGRRLLRKSPEKSGSTGNFVFIPHGNPLVQPLKNNRFTGNFTFVPSGNLFVESKRNLSSTTISSVTISAKFNAERKLLKPTLFLLQKYMEKVNKIYENLVDKEKYNVALYERGIVLNTAYNNGNMRGKIMVLNHLTQYSLYLNKNVKKNLNFETVQAIYKNKLVFDKILNNGNYISEQSRVDRTNQCMRDSDFKYADRMKETNLVKKYVESELNKMQAEILKQVKEDKQKLIMHNSFRPEDIRSISEKVYRELVKKMQYERQRNGVLK